MRIKPFALLIPIAASLLLAIGGCGGSSASGDNTAALAPQSSFLYIEAQIDPTGSQEQKMRTILADVPGGGDPSQRLHQLFEKATKADKTSKVDWRKDIQPWLGDRAGLFVAGPANGSNDFAYGIVIATKDTGKTQASIEKDTTEKRSYKGVDYRLDKDTAEAVVGGFFVAGSEAGMKAAIDASKGAGLDQADGYKQVIAGVKGEHIGFIYEDFGALIGALAHKAEGQLGPLAPLLGSVLGGKPTVATIRAEDQALVIDGPVIPLPAAFKKLFSGTPLMGSVPSSSWLALGLPDLGGTVKGLVDLFAAAAGGKQKLKDELAQSTGLDLDRDLLDWIGDVAFFVQGDSKATLGGGALIQSKDPAASKLALTKIAAFITRQQGTHVAAARIGGATGYSVSDPSLPKDIFFLQRDSTVAVTYGDAAARDAFGDNALSSEAGFKRASTALGGGYRPIIYVTVAPILRLADSFGAGKDKGYREARPYLAALDYLIAGSGGSEGGRIRIGFKPSR